MLEGGGGVSGFRSFSEKKTVFFIDASPKGQTVNHWLQLLFPKRQRLRSNMISMYIIYVSMYLCIYVYCPCGDWELLGFLSYSTISTLHPCESLGDTKFRACVASMLVSLLLLWNFAVLQLIKGHKHAAGSRCNLALCKLKWEELQLGLIFTLAPPTQCSDQNLK